MDTMPPMAKLAQKLAARNTLTEADRDAILALPHKIRSYDANAYIVREGDRAKRACSFLLSGFAFRQNLTRTGARQIMALNMPGDILDLQHLFLKVADHNVQALTDLETAELDGDALRTLATERPAVGEAMWIEALIDASIFREWILNVGRRDARARIAHLLCEFATRMEALGLGNGGRYELPMTQEQLGDATGLTSVHVNRTLRSLVEDGLVHRDRRFLSFSNWEDIRSVADFNSRYLHLDQSRPTSE